MNTVAERTISASAGEPAAAGARKHPGVESTHTPLGTSWATVLFGLAVMFVLYLGWRWRDAGYITAEHGLGYALGIVGGVMMALLLLYPLRKKQARFFRWGAIRYWFRMHMIFGVLGPVIILYHSSFKLGAINSNVALISMLLVAGSGLVGRYFYTRIHYGLYGARMTLDGLRQRAGAAQGRVAALFRQVPEAMDTLNRLEQWLLRERNGLVRLLMLPFIAVRCGFVRWRLVRMLRRALVAKAKESGDAAHASRRSLELASQFVSAYVETLRRVAEIGTYERLFSWWHVLHLPLFLMMLLAGVVHVVAVHMY